MNRDDNPEIGLVRRDEPSGGPPKPAAKTVGKTDRSLLFGIVAVQMNFITREGLVSGMKAWLVSKQRSLGEILVEMALMQAEHRKMLEPLVTAFLQQYDNDPKQCLAALSSITSIEADLDQLRDPDLTLSFQQVSESQDSKPIAEDKGTGPSKLSGVRFKILRPHAKGGLGQVSVALDKELNREVALKEIQKKHLGDQSSRERFVLEAEITGGLQHPGIVPVYGLGQFPDGSPFYAMRFIRGDSLKAAIEEYHEPNARPHKTPSDRRLELRKLLGRFIDVCNAMEYAHSRGVLHRDLKPGNIMLGKYGETLVVDWGLAKALGHNEIESEEPTLVPSSSMSSSGQTRPGSALGTPAYMSPEQAAGKLDELGPETDVYSLGATMYHLLTGQAPFKGKPLEVMKQVREGNFVHPRKLASETPPALEAICLKAMSLKPRQRYSSPRLMAEDLERWLADEPVKAHAETWSERLTRLERKHRSWVRAGTAASATIAVLAIVAALWINVERDKSTKLAIAEASAKTDALKAKDLADKQRVRADDNARVANANAELERIQRKRADAKELEARHQLYLDRMNFAQAAWEDARVDRVLQLLEPYSAGSPSERLRGFEWFYWNRQCHRDLQTLKGHTQSVHGVAFSPDGTRIASASGDQTAKLWDLATGQEIATLKGHTSFLKCIAFSPDGARIATGGGDMSVKIWNVGTGQEIATLKGHTKEVSGVAFSPDGTRIASASGDKTVKLWNSLTGDETGTLKGHSEWVREIVFSPDGARIASASNDKTVKLWDVIKGHEIATLKGHLYGVSSVAFSPDGTRIASGSADSTVKIWDTNTFMEVAILKGHEEKQQIFAVAYSPDGARIASASSDRTVKVWDPATGQERATLHPGGVVMDLTFSPDGTRIATAGDEDRAVKLWDVTTGDEFFKGKTHTSSVDCVAFSSDNTRLASASADRTIKIWDVITGQEIATLKGHAFGVVGVAFSPVGSLIASASADRTVKLWDATTFGEVATLKGHEARVNAVAFSPDGLQLVSAGWDHTVRLWSVDTHHEIANLKGHTKKVNSVSFSPDGTRIVSGSEDFTIKLWNTASGETTATLKGHAYGVECVAFNPDGTRIVSVSNDHTVKLWDVATGQETATLSGHTGWVRGVAFSPDGMRLASSSNDGTVKLWDVTTGQEAATLKGHAGWVSSVAFSSDGTRLASSSWGNYVTWANTLKLWDAREWTPELRLEQQACCLFNTVASKATTRESLIKAIESNRTFTEPAKKLAVNFATAVPLLEYPSNGK